MPPESRLLLRILHEGTKLRKNTLWKKEEVKRKASNYLKIERTSILGKLFFKFCISELWHKLYSMLINLIN